jgi:TPR repeat protein
MRHTVLRLKQAIVIPIALGLVLSPAGLQFYGASESFAQTAPNSAQQRCDELAGDPRDPSQVGRGVPFAKIQVTEALPACQAAANVAPVQPHYQFLYGRVLQKAERYDEAFQQYNSAAAGGDAGAMHNLGVFYENGLGVATSDAEAQSWYRRAEQARRVEETNKAAAISQASAGIAESDANIASPDSNRADSASKEGMNNNSSGGRTGESVAAEVSKAPDIPGLTVDAKNGDPAAKVKVGLAYCKAGRDLEARWMFEKAAAAGSVRAMLYAGRLYTTGNGSATAWFRKCADLGDVSCEAMLGYEYEQGHDNITKITNRQLTGMRKQLSKGA